MVQRQTGDIFVEDWMIAKGLLVGKRISQSSTHGQARDPGILQPDPEWAYRLPSLIHEPEAGRIRRLQQEHQILFLKLQQCNSVQR